MSVGKACVRVRLLCGDFDPAAKVLTGVSRQRVACSGLVLLYVLVQGFLSICYQCRVSTEDGSFPLGNPFLSRLVVLVS